MKTEFSEMRDYWAQFYLEQTQLLINTPSKEAAFYAYEFADAMMREAGHDPDSTD